MRRGRRPGPRLAAFVTALLMGQMPGLQPAEAADMRIETVPFENSAFPYRGVIPEKDKPFLDARDGSRRGHTSPRGGVYWEDRTYSDRSVLLAIPPGFDPRRPAAIVVFFHGNQATLGRDVVRRQRVPAQLARSGLNAVLVAPQLAVDALDSSAGRFWERGFFSRFLDEAAGRLAALSGEPAEAFARLPVIVVAYSGGYLPAAYSLLVGGAGSRVRGVVLFDALYAEEEKFAAWAAANHGHAFFFAASGESSRAGAETVRRILAGHGIRSSAAAPERIAPGSVTLLSAGNANHNDFMTRAWTSDPLAWVLSRVAVEALAPGG